VDLAGSAPCRAGPRDSNPAERAPRRSITVDPGEKRKLTMTRSTSSGSAAVRSGPKISATLDRRRNALHASRSAAEATGAKVASLDEALDSNAMRRSEYEANLQVALDRVAGLKKTIKASKQERSKLRTARKAARQADAKARQRADTSEAKYDRAVLADMLRREKDRDLSVHAEPPATAPTAAAAPTAATAPTAAAAPTATAAPMASSAPTATAVNAKAAAEPTVTPGTSVAGTGTGTGTGASTSSSIAGGGGDTSTSGQPASGGAGQTTSSA